MLLQDTHTIQCPYCAENIEIVVDYSAGDQEYTEDCQVCCRPIVLEIYIKSDTDVDIKGQREND